jgi:hypothetical protein
MRTLKFVALVAALALVACGGSMQAEETNPKPASQTQEADYPAAGESLPADAEEEEEEEEQDEPAAPEEAAATDEDVSEPEAEWSDDEDDGDGDEADD